MSTILSKDLVVCIWPGGLAACYPGHLHLFHARADVLTYSFRILAAKKRLLEIKLIHDIGGSAAAAGSLVAQLGGTIAGYLFMIEIVPLNGREKLGNHPIMTLLETGA